MKVRGSYEVAAPPEKVFAYFANPRHVVIANHDGPLIERSEGEQGVGSWYVMAFDQLRMRVEYTVYDPPSRIGARVTSSGRGSGGSAFEHEWEISALPDGRGSRVEIFGVGRGGFWPLNLLYRPFTWLAGRRAKRAIERGA